MPSLISHHCAQPQCQINKQLLQYFLENELRGSRRSYSSSNWAYKSNHNSSPKLDLTLSNDHSSEKLEPVPEEVIDKSPRPESAKKAEESEPAKQPTEASGQKVMLITKCPHI